MLHDLRRSVSTHMGEIGIQPHVNEKVLNHALPGVAGKYNRTKLEEPKRQALEAWAEVLMAHVEGREPADNVLSGRFGPERSHFWEVPAFWEGPGKVRSRYSALHAAT